ARQRARDRARPRRADAQPLPRDFRLPAEFCSQGRSVPENLWGSWRPSGETHRDPSAPPKRGHPIYSCSRDVNMALTRSIRIAVSLARSEYERLVYGFVSLFYMLLTGFLLC